MWSHRALARTDQHLTQFSYISALGSLGATTAALDSFGCLEEGDTRAIIPSLFLIAMRGNLPSGSEGP